MAGTDSLAGVEVFSETSSIMLDAKSFPLSLVRSRRITLGNPYLGPEGYLRLENVPLNRVVFIAHNSPDAISVSRVDANEMLGPADGVISQNILVLECKTQGAVVDIFEFERGAAPGDSDFGLTLTNAAGVVTFNTSTFLVGIDAIAAKVGDTTISSGRVAFSNTFPVIHIVSDGSGGFGGAICAAGITNGRVFRPKMFRYTYGFVVEEPLGSWQPDTLLIDCSALPVPYARASTL